MKEILAPYKLRRVKAFVDAHLHARMTLAMLAQASGASAYHFSRAFRNSTGESPYQYVLRRRIERAKDILTSSERELPEVATACGFRDARHLTKTFQRLTGIRPNHFRNYAPTAAG